MLEVCGWLGRSIEVRTASQTIQLIQVLLVLKTFCSMMLRPRDFLMRELYGVAKIGATEKPTSRLIHVHIRVLKSLYACLPVIDYLPPAADPLGPGNFSTTAEKKRPMYLTSGYMRPFLEFLGI